MTPLFRTLPSVSLALRHAGHVPTPSRLLIEPRRGD